MFRHGEISKYCFHFFRIIIKEELERGGRRKEIDKEINIEIGIVMRRAGGGSSLIKLFNGETNLLLGEITYI